MNKIKSLGMSLVALLFITACGSASSDAKKVDVNPAKKAEAVQVAEAKTGEAMEKAASATQDSEFIEGKHYVKISPEMQTNATAGKVEVIELMWLGCPHCYSLEPTMLKYKKNHPPYVEFQQVPAMLNPSWSADANTYYLAEVLDPSGEKELITKIFHAIHEQRRRLRNPEAVSRFFIQLGYTAEQIKNAKESMLYRTNIKRAQSISVASQAQSVPVVIINGKYRTSPYMAGNEERMMKILDMLTRREKK